MKEAQKDSLDYALDHSWKWFELHARQRLQAVNFFLIATAFLVKAYVDTIPHPFMGAAIALIGIIISACFYLFEIRIRQLVKAGENALIPVQQLLAELTD